MAPACSEYTTNAATSQYWLHVGGPQSLPVAQISHNLLVDKASTDSL